MRLMAIRFSDEAFEYIQGRGGAEYIRRLINREMDKRYVVKDGLILKIPKNKKRGYRAMKKENPLQKGQRYTANAEIRKMMQEKGIRQSVLSVEMGVAVSTLNRYLKTEMPANMKAVFMETIRRM